MRNNQLKAPRRDLNRGLPGNRPMQDHRASSNVWSRSNGDNRPNSSEQTELLRCNLSGRRDRHDSRHRVSVSQLQRHDSSSNSSDERSRHPSRRFEESRAR